MDLPLPLAFAVQQGLNALLKLDPHTQNALSSINGKVIRVEVTAPSLTMHLIVVDGNIDVEGGFDAQPDTTIAGTASDLLSLRNKNDALYTGAVKISGEMGTGEQLRQIISGIEIEPEEIIAPITGDAFAHQLGLIGAQVGAWLSDTGESMKRNTSEYLQEESEVIAPNSEVRRFCNAIDSLREDADRLIARLDILEKNQDEPS